MSESTKIFNFEISDNNIERLFNISETKRDFYASIKDVLNRTRTTLKTKAFDEVSRRYNIRKKDFNKHTKVKDKIDYDSAAIGVSFKGQKIPLSAFVSNGNNRKINDIVKARIEKGGNTSEYRHAFIGRTAEGNKVFERLTSKRTPLREITTLAVPQIINNKDIRETMKNDAYLTLNKRIEHEITRLTNKWGTK